MRKLVSNSIVFTLQFKNYSALVASLALVAGAASSSAALTQIFTEDLVDDIGAFTGSSTLTYQSAGTGRFRGINNSTGASANAANALTGITGEGMLVATFDARPRGDSQTSFDLTDTGGNVLFSFGNPLADADTPDTVLEVVDGAGTVIASITSGITTFTTGNSTYIDFELRLDSVANTVEFLAAPSNLDAGPTGPFVSSGVVTATAFSIANLTDVRLTSFGPGGAGDVLDNPTVSFMADDSIPEPSSALLALVGALGLLRRRR